MLHPYRTASKIQVSLVESVEESSPALGLLSVLCGIDGWLGRAPSVQSSAQGKSIYILYRDAAFLVEDFFEAFGPEMAFIGETWPVCAYGTARNQETVRLWAEREGNSCRFVQESISGSSADVLQTLCLQVDCPEKEEAEQLASFLKAVSFKPAVAAVEWKSAEFLRRQNLLLPVSSGTFFCYGGGDPASPPGECLSALDFSQKVSLWNAFLGEGLEPVEFEWLAEEIAQGSIENRMEWELALRDSMDQLGCRIVNGKNAFQIYDGAGNRLYFGADGRHAAELALIKILFPLNYQ